MATKNVTFPVQINKEYRVVPTGKAATDVYVKMDGFIIFIKKVPEEAIQEEMIIKITALKETYGFGVFVNFA